jgi:HlyD family secretion protein
MKHTWNKRGWSMQQLHRLFIRTLVVMMLLAWVCLLAEQARCSENQPMGKKVKRETAAVVTMSTSPKVSTIGYIEPGDGIIRVSANSYLTHFAMGTLLVSEGDSVTKGQVIGYLGAYPVFDAAVNLAQKDLEAARERRSIALKMIEVGELPAQEARIRRLEAELAFLEADQTRVDSLRKKNVVTDSEQEATLSRRKAKFEEVREAVHLHRSLKEKWDSEIRLADIGISHAEWALAKAHAERDLCIIRAPVAGRILEIFAREGEAIRDTGILSIGETGRMYAVAEVYQSDISKVRIGDLANVTAEGLGVNLTGTVERIGLVVQRNQLANPDIAADIDSRVIRVRIRLDKPELVAGLTNLRVTIGIH